MNAPADGAHVNLNDIAREGEFLGAGDPGPEPRGPEPVPDADAAQIAMWAMVPRTMGSVLALAMPELREVYSDAACDMWGAAMLPVAKKHGWTTDTLGPELALLAASVPFVIGTGIAIMRRRQEQAGARAAPAPGAASRPGAGVHVDAAPPDINAAQPGAPGPS